MAHLFANVVSGDSGFSQRVRQSPEHPKQTFPTTEIRDMKSGGRHTFLFFLRSLHLNPLNQGVYIGFNRSHSASVTPAFSKRARM